MDEDKKLWQSGGLDPETPQGLLYFLNGKNLCLRGGAEHCDLKISQLQRDVVQLRGKSVVRYTYTELVLKNRAGGLKQIKQAKNNRIPVQKRGFESLSCPTAWQVLVKIATRGQQKDIFYLRAKASLPTDPEDRWFTPVPVCQNILEQMMKTMATAGKLEKAVTKAVTNHTLRSYGVSKIIMERSGHHSLQGVRQYERTNALQEVQVCTVLETSEQFGQPQANPTPSRAHNTTCNTANF